MAQPSTRTRSLALLGVLIVIACGLAASTYSIFCHTWDEPEHLAAGMALLQTGQYPYDVQHPPLARLAMAIGPALAGAHGYGTPGPSGELEGRDILYREGHYQLYLTLARIGMLPFLALLLISVWLWTKLTFDRSTAVVATALVVVTPVVIGHAAVAALDVPMAATTLFALYWLLRWFDAPSLKHALLFGLTAGIASGTKLSAPPFIGCTLIAWSLAWLWQWRTASTETRPDTTLRTVVGHTALAGIMAALALIACYGFAWTTLSPQFPIPVPVGIPRVIDSLNALLAHNDGGHLSFFMGELRTTGWWDFYLVALAVKTPLPLLVCALAGWAWSMMTALRSRHWQLAAPALAFGAILLFASAYSHINIGVRHVMVLYPLMAIMAAAFVVALWRKYSQMQLRAVWIALGAAQLGSMIWAAPDYLAYFNVLAGKHPEHILVDSDLDWGQDVHRLEIELQKRHVTDFAIVYRGTAELRHEHLPHYRRLPPDQRATGWIAVSLLAKAIGSDDHGYDWLDAYTPVMRVGKSIDLYYIPK